MLVKGSAGYIKSEKDWRIVLQIVQMTAVDPGLHVVALEAISHVVTDTGMHPSAFKPCFDNIQMLMDRTKVGRCSLCYWSSDTQAQQRLVQIVTSLSHNVMLHSCCSCYRACHMLHACLAGLRPHVVLAQRPSRSAYPGYIILCNCPLVPTATGSKDSLHTSLQIVEPLSHCSGKLE